MTDEQKEAFDKDARTLFRSLAYASGFRAAKAAAIKAIEDTDCVYPRDTMHCQLGDAEATKYAAIDNVAKLEPKI